MFNSRIPYQQPPQQRPFMGASMALQNRAALAQTPQMSAPLQAPPVNPNRALIAQAMMGKMGLGNQMSAPKTPARAVSY